MSVSAIALEVAPSHVAATDTGTAVNEIVTCCDRTWNLQDTLYLRYGASILSLAENLDRNKLNPLRIIYRRTPTRRDSLNTSQKHRGCGAVVYYFEIFKVLVRYIYTVCPIHTNNELDILL